MKRLLISAALLLGLFLAIGSFTALTVDRFMDTEVSVQEQGTTFVIEGGRSFAWVASTLQSQGIIDEEHWFKLYARWAGEATNIQAGEYLIQPGSTPRDLLRQFQQGDVRLHVVTIVEGWNHRELLQALHANEAITASMTNEDWPALLESLGSPQSHPEGLFLPETYHVPRGTTDKEILREAYNLLQKELAASWANRSESNFLKTPYEALILASIVEKETARADERERISGVFIRRLQKGMRLQTDPTVIYGIGPAFDGDLTREHLRTDTPYNTYTRRGLPPTPIALAGKAAIDAALHPQDGDELFFVATGLGDGSHKFSVTLAQHDEAVAEYLRRLRQARPGGIQ